MAVRISCIFVGDWMICWKIIETCWKIIQKCWKITETCWKIIGNHWYLVDLGRTFGKKAGFFQVHIVQIHDPFVPCFKRYILWRTNTLLLPWYMSYIIYIYIHCIYIYISICICVCKYANKSISSFHVHFETLYLLKRLPTIQVIWVFFFEMSAEDLLPKKG